MVELLVILDGASEPLREEPTSLERARTPVLDGLAAYGALTLVQTTPAGLPAGSETAIPVLLGWTPPAAVDRGRVEAAARGLTTPEAHHAWRIDVLDGTGRRADDAVTRARAVWLGARLPEHEVRSIGRHRLLVTGPRPRPSVAAADLRWWPEGVVPPGILDSSTVIVAARGAASGLGRLMGARVIVPPGATGGTDTDLAAKVAGAASAVRDGATRVVVHVGGPDEASHERDRAGKVRALERIDSELIAPLSAIARRSGATLRIGPDHNCDPLTGRHDDAPVPSLSWSASSVGVGPRSRRRLTERSVRHLSSTGSSVELAATP